MPVLKKKKITARKGASQKSATKVAMKHATKPAHAIPQISARLRARREKLLRETTALPTAAGREERVIADVEMWIKGIGPRATMTRDAYGNLHIHRSDAVSNGASNGASNASPHAPPLYITAHLDHPAFVVREVKGARVLVLEFRGGVNDPYFDRAKIEVIDAKGRAHRARITVLDATAKPFKTVAATLARRASSVAAGDIARWLLPKPRVARGIFYTHACDDLAAVAAAMCAFEESLSNPALSNMRILFTRSEEIGFIGALGVARDGLVPKDSRLVCLENSRSFPHDSPMGAGPIVRVGDRITVFSPALTNRISLIAVDVAKEDPTFRFQRKLMAGGACEASAFASYGFLSTCLCLPLGNYHNMQDIDAVIAGKRPARVGSEHIALEDYHGLIRLIMEVARRIDVKPPEGEPADPVHALMERLWSMHHAIVGG
ncbi:MAG: hypothetical protein EXS10_06355 [Phycisphaerales bacterium]|nr:hypothetical protein [Phycisphaerales bacterium]